MDLSQQLPILIKVPKIQSMFTSLVKVSILISNLQMVKVSQLMQLVDNLLICLESNMMQFKTLWIKWDLSRTSLNRIDIVIHLKKNLLIMGNCLRLEKILITWLFLLQQAKGQLNSHKVPLILQEELRAKEERDHETATKCKGISTWPTNTLLKLRVAKDCHPKQIYLMPKLKFSNW